MFSTKCVFSPLILCVYKNFKLKKNIISHHYHIYPKYLDRQAKSNSVGPVEMLQNSASDQGLYCLPLFQELLDASQGSKMVIFKF